MRVPRTATARQPAPAPAPACACSACAACPWPWPTTPPATTPTATPSATCACPAFALDSVRSFVSHFLIGSELVCPEDRELSPPFAASVNAYWNVPRPSYNGLSVRVVASMAVGSEFFVGRTVVTYTASAITTTGPVVASCNFSVVVNGKTGRLHSPKTRVPLSCALPSSPSAASTLGAALRAFVSTTP